MSDLCNMCRPPDERSAPAGMSPLAPSRAILDKNGRQLISIDSHVLVGPMAAERHAHHELEISCVPSGYGTYHINEKFYDIRPGDVFILPNTDYH
ncbi:MAG: cupin domain-containing protein, partial [Oscillospiraceae bacterium]|nr:cupin domain-containing protein [Oscillospiraceae bacterium]